MSGSSTAVRGQLPSGTPGGALTPSSPGALARTPRVSTSTTPSVQPRLSGSSTAVRGQLPSGTPGGSVVNPSTSPKSAAATRSSVSAGTSRVSGTASRGSLPPTDNPGSRTIDVTYKDVTKNPESLRKLPATQASRSVATKLRAAGAGAGAAESGLGLGGLAIPAAVGAVAGPALDMAFPRPTAPGTLKSAPKIPTRPGQVKVGGTYYDPNMSVGPLGRYGARMRVGSGSQPKPEKGAGYVNIPGKGMRYYSSSDRKYYNNYNDALAARNSRRGLLNRPAND